MRLHTSVVAAALLVGGLAKAQRGEVNAISKVEVADSGGTMAVSIKGTKPPNFTTFTLMDPPRFVIDLSESSVQGVPGEIPVKGGVLGSISSRSFGSGASSIVRVMLAFDQDVDPPDVTTAGNTLVVTIAKPGGAGTAVAESAAPAPAPAPEKPTVAVASATPGGTARAKADEESKAKAKEDAPVRAEEAAQAKADEEAKAEREAQAKADEEARAEREAQAKADEEAKAKRAAQAKVDELARAKADREARARADKEARRKADEVVEADTKPESAQPPAALASAETSKPPLTATEEEPAPVPISTPSREPEPSPVPRSNVSEVPGGPRQIEEVGFQQLPEASRVFVRTDRIPVYSISESGDKMVRVELENTRAHRRNDSRKLDTSFFPSAVEEIAPRREGSAYVLEIRLKQKVSFQQKIEGNMLAIDFERPPGQRGPVSLAPAAPVPVRVESVTLGEDSWTIAPLAERSGSEPSAPAAPVAPTPTAAGEPAPPPAPASAPAPASPPAPETGQ